VTHTHWDANKLPMTMPNPLLTRDQAREVTQYILGLRGH